MQATADACLRLSVPNEREGIERARLQLLGFLEPARLSAKTLFHIELILEETLMNTVWHAYDDADTHSIALQVQLRADAVALRFEDDGRAFDPTQAAAPALPTSLAQATPGGLGLLLVRQFAQSVHYERVGGLNVLTVCVARS